MSKNRYAGVLTALCWILLTGATARAQELRGFKLLRTFSKEGINFTAPKVFGNKLPRATQDLRLYRVTYTSTDQNGKRAVLSALLALPTGGAPRGLVLWNHGTITSQKLAPSNYKMNAGLIATEAVWLAFGSGGYAVAMPDYLGFGVHKGAHPYPMGKINARSALDLINPSRAVALRLKRTIGKNLFVSGYSQGGAVAMWVARLLQERGTPATRSAALSGPYDLTGVTRQSLLTTPKEKKQLLGQMFLAGLMGDGYLKNSRKPYTDLFRPAMAKAVQNAFATDKPDDQRVEEFAKAAKLEHAKNLRDVLSPQFAVALDKVDVRHPLIKQMRESDCLDWTPKAPMLMWALESDGIVVAANTTKAVASFRARGVGTNVVRAVMRQDPLADHASAAVPALLATRLFFDKGFAAVPEAK